MATTAHLQQQTTSQPATQATPSPFPIPQATASALISSTPTTATRLSFADKTLLLLTQNNQSPTHWLHVPLLAESPLTDPSTHLLQTSHFYSDEDEEGDEEGGKRVDNSLLPFPHLTATTVLGGTREEDRVLGGTIGVTVASALLMKMDGMGGGGGSAGGMIVLGLGLESGSVVGRAEFEELVGLCLEVL